MVILNLEHAKYLIKELEQFFKDREKARDKWIGDVINHLPVVKESRNVTEYINYDNVCIFRHRVDHDGFQGGILWVNYDLVWKVLSKDYEMSYNQIQDYIRDHMYEHRSEVYEHVHCFSAPEYSGKMITKNPSNYE